EGDGGRLNGRIPRRHRGHGGAQKKLKEKKEEKERLNKEYHGGTEGTELRGERGKGKGERIERDGERLNRRIP
ncbi:MAG: hypothetical protein K9H49_14045, partial [Bacteroidales bacterium]|nr:hypothetical protein [Bacteroidales bacterium]MCF8390293.1 hypothetical protein [Bacteroidales bacterium]